MAGLFDWLSAIGIARAKLRADVTARARHDAF
jgi:hypothetical protein